LGRFSSCLGIVYDATKGELFVANGDNDTVSVLSDSYSTFSSPSQAPSALVVVAVVVVALSVVAIASLVYFKKKGSDRRFRDKVEGCL
jgi:DNA-binding beta-propeller fold protein YncE